MITTTKIILTIAPLLGAFGGLRANGVLHKVISIGILCIALLSWLPRVPLLSASQSFALMGLCLLTAIYAFTVKELSNLERVSISTMGILLFANTAADMLHVLIALPLTLALVIPLLAWLETVIIQKRVFTKELSFMGPWIVYAFFKLTRLWF